MIRCKTLMLKDSRVGVTRLPITIVFLDEHTCYVLIAARADTKV